MKKSKPPPPELRLISVRLPADLFERAKIAAVRERITMQQLVAEALGRRLTTGGK